MHKVTGFVLAAVAAVVLLAGVRADEEKVPLDKVPKDVLDAVKAKFPGAKLLGASTEKEKGKTVYEVSLTYKKHHHDVTLQPDGKILDIEREIPVKDLPKAVSEALAAKYATATPKKAEELLKGDGKLHAYEVVLTSGDTTLEVVLDPMGKVLKEEKHEKKKKSAK